MSIVERLRQLGRAEWTARRGSGARNASPQQLLKEARAELAGLAAEERRRRQRYQDALDRAAGYREQAEAWVRRGRDESATAFLRQEALVRKEAEGLRQSLDEVQRALEDLRRALRHAQEQLQGAPLDAREQARPEARAGLFRDIETAAPTSAESGALRPHVRATQRPEPSSAWPEPVQPESPTVAHDDRASPATVERVDTVRSGPPWIGSDPPAWPEAPAPEPEAFAAVQESLSALESWQHTMDRQDAELSLTTLLYADSGGEDSALEARFRQLENDRNLDDLRKRAGRRNEGPPSEGGGGPQP